MMFASGVVKLQSGCKEWWGLTAMPLHYESQCIPTWLSWWAYNIPYPTLHKLSVALTFVTEIPVVLLFYHPVKSVRKFAFFLQVQLMIGIMLTGEYKQVHTVVPRFRVLGFSALPGFRALKAGDGAWSVHKTLFGFKAPLSQLFI